MLFCEWLAGVRIATGNETKMKYLITEKMIDPFRYNSADVTNISADQLASSNELVEAKERGLKALTIAQDKTATKWNLCT